MAINIKFDSVGNPDTPTIVLANRNGNKLGQLDINPESIELIDKFNAPSEISFTVNKYVDGKITNLWDELVDFKLVYCKEWLVWFEIKVELDEATESIKTVFCTQLGQAELSQTMLYNIEINTEDDIARDDYKITKFYNPENSKASLLDRLLEKAPHYSIDHIDSTLEDIQRSFSFDDISIYDAFQEVAEEIGCLFVFNSDSDADGMPKRSISIYDLQQNCKSCDYRGEFTDVCPKCGETDKEKIRYGYGVDTSIFVTSDELASNGIQLTTDTDSVKNCFKLEAGDDLMTATIRNRNPNGSDYIWYFSDATKADMPDKLVKKIEEYDDTYRKYYNDYSMKLNSNKYNKLIKRYKKYDEDLEQIPNSIKGFVSLMNAYYNTIDLNWFLKSGLMPSVSMSKTNAGQQANLLSILLPPLIGVADLEKTTLTTADSTVLAMAKTVVNSAYKVSIVKKSSSLKDGTWSGKFTITNYSDEKDKATVTISRGLTGWDETYIKQKIDKMLNKEEVDNLDIVGLFGKDYDEFCAELKKYALTPLNSFYDACQACIDILIEQGTGDKDKSWKEENVLYKSGSSYNDSGSYNDTVYKNENLMVVTKSSTSVEATLNLNASWEKSENGNLIVTPESSSSVLVELNFNPNAYGTIYISVSKVESSGNLIVIPELEISNIEITPGEHYSNYTVLGLEPNTEYMFQCMADSVGGLTSQAILVTPPTLEILVRKANDYSNILDNLSVKNIEVEMGNNLYSHTITGLSPNTEYAFTCNSQPFSDSYAVVTFTTSTGESSSGKSNESLMVKTLSTTKVQAEISFENSKAGTVTMYVYEGKTIKDKTPLKSVEIKVSSGSHSSIREIDGLSEGNEYTIVCDCSNFGSRKLQLTFTMPSGKLYGDLYDSYYNKLIAIQDEIDTRENEIDTVLDLQLDIEKLKTEIQDALDFEKYLGEDLWLEFCAYRREDKYSNSNYISDGLTNTELFERALEFYEVAENEIFKSSELQHSITATLNNLLAIPKFEPLVNSFNVGNWIRVQIDGNIYKLRLIEYRINYGDFDKISVEFSDVAKVRNGYSDLESILSDASAMASSYDSLQRQASSGDEARNMIRKWLNEGLDASLVQIQNNTNEDITIDNNGLIGRSYSDITDEYSDEQIRLTHNIIAYTDDNWKSVKQAIGKHKYKYYDEGTDKTENGIGYGMSAEFVTAGFISGSQIISGNIYSENYSESENKGSHINLIDGTFSFGGGALTFDGEKLTISGDDSNITSITEDWLRTGTVFTELLQASKISADQITTGSLEGQTITGGTIKGTTIEGGTIKGIEIKSTKDVTTTLTAVDINTSTLTGNTITGGDIIGGQVYVTGEGAEENSALYICNGYTTKTDAEGNIIEKKPNVAGFISYDSHGKSDKEIYDGKYIAQERIIFETSIGMSMKIQTLGYSDSPGFNNDDNESNNVPVANISIGAGLLTDAEHISTGYCGEGYVYIASPIIFSGKHNSYSTYDGCDVQFGTGSNKKCKVDFTYATVKGLDIDTVAKFG